MKGVGSAKHPGGAYLAKVALQLLSLGGLMLRAPSSTCSGRPVWDEFAKVDRKGPSDWKAARHS